MRDRNNSANHQWLQCVIGIQDEVGAIGEPTVVVNARVL